VDVHVDVGSRPALERSSPHEGTAAGLSPSRLLVLGVASGLAGGIALAMPVVVWDWERLGHRALELPMAATAWLFGLTHFSHERNLWWPIVLGLMLLAAYCAVSGVLFATLADRVFKLSRPASTLAAGAGWSFVSFMFFWYMLLPIARDGVPFRAPTRGLELFAAPSWVWILGFTLLGLVTAACYAALRRSPVVQREEVRVERRRLTHAA
jgi:hypothetical protein